MKYGPHQCNITLVGTYIYVYGSKHGHNSISAS